jgi:UDP-glucose 4-epimerase
LQSAPSIKLIRHTHALQSMKDNGCKNFVYSSSATVYGEPETIPIPETSPLQPHSPYAKTKVFCEYILMDLAKGE